MTNGIIKLITGSLACVSILLAGPASAQIHTPNLPENKWLVLAEEQYLQKQYGNAAQSAGRYLKFQKEYPRTYSYQTQEKARFIAAVSSLKLNGNHSVDSALVFIRETSSPAYRQRTAYALAQYYFQHNRFNEAIPYYEMAGIANLSNDEIANAKFELAYCYFNNQEFDKATPLFSAIREYPGAYNSAGNYYYGLLAYNQGNFKSALESFEKIDNEKEYRTVVPYYIAEIHYFMGNRDKALADALKLIKRPEKSFYDKELHLLAAQVLFEEQRYGEALPYFEQYYNNVEKIRKEDLYEMAYSYYRVKEWKNAIDKFKPLSNSRDSLGQTAMYLLGDCYLMVGDKKSARNAFSICADMPFNPAQQEASLLLSGKLSYEMGFYDAGISYINNLLTAFPNTKYKDEAKTLLSSLLIRTNNYSEAYAALKDVGSRDANYNATYQKVAYGYAMKQMQAGNYTEAYSLLGQSLQYPIDRAYTAAAYFWRGDIAYRQNQFSDAVVYTQRYLNSDADKQDIQRISPAANIHNAYINMGYASMKLEDFSAAQSYFNKAQEAKSDDAVFAMNATLREADAVFMQKEYAKAISLYDKVIAADGEDADYARFQKAIILGVTGKQAEKSEILQGLISRQPPSPYSYDARYEQALTYLQTNKFQQAIDMLMPLTKTDEKRNMAPKAWMKIGFAYQQMDNDSKAIEAYRRVAIDYPSAEERYAALDALKGLYIENNQPAAYAQLLKDYNLTSPDDASLDSTYYAAAEAQYASGKWEAAKQALQKYLQQYPNGVFVNKAHFYKGESHYQLKEYQDALTNYDAVIQNGWSDFTENSARRAASIAFTNKDYQTAIVYYQALRSAAMSNENLQQAYNGLMQSHYALTRYNEAAAYADTLASLPGLDEQMLNSVQLYKAKSLQQFDKADEALTIYRSLQSSKTGAIAAEARYHVGEILFEQGKYKEAEEAAGNTIKSSGGYDYWIVKSYILLADILTKQKDYFNAKATLQSIVKNTKIAELKQEATKKLEHVKMLEKKQSKLSEE